MDLLGAENGLFILFCSCGLKLFSVFWGDFFCTTVQSKFFLIDRICMLVYNWAVDEFHKLKKQKRINIFLHHCNKKGFVCLFFLPLCILFFQQKKSQLHWNSWILSFSSLCDSLSDIISSFYGHTNNLKYVVAVVSIYSLNKKEYIYLLLFYSVDI